MERVLRFLISSNLSFTAHVLDNVEPMARASYRPECHRDLFSFQDFWLQEKTELCDLPGPFQVSNFTTERQRKDDTWIWEELLKWLLSRKPTRAKWGKVRGAIGLETLTCQKQVRWPTNNRKRIVCHSWKVTLNEDKLRSISLSLCRSKEYSNP